jgi:hypothetical protein
MKPILDWTKSKAEAVEGAPAVSVYQGDDVRFGS